MQLKESILSVTAEGLALLVAGPLAGRMYKWWHKDPQGRTDMGLFHKKALDAPAMVWIKFLQQAFLRIYKTVGVRKVVRKES